MALLIKTKIYVQVGTERPTKLMLVMELLLFYKSIFYRACHSNICIIYYISITLIFISRSTDLKQAVQEGQADAIGSTAGQAGRLGLLLN